MLPAQCHQGLRMTSCPLGPRSQRNCCADSAATQSHVSFSTRQLVAQAMAAYRTAARLFPGLHLPLAGMGMEYARMNNAALAEQLLLASHRTCPADPLACHELGCLAFRGRQLPAAERWLMMALKRVPGRHDRRCALRVENMGCGQRSAPSSSWTLRVHGRMSADKPISPGPVRRSRAYRALDGIQISVLQSTPT